MEKIGVIGCGISGVTTAFTLQLLGYETTIYADKIPHEITNINSHPDFASLYPSASIIPHSVYSDRLKELFLESQSFFYELHKLLFPGITIHKHFEVFEFEAQRPDYGNWMLNFHSIEELGHTEIPHRPGVQNLHGWVFDCLFTDWPIYFPALIEAYERSGGIIRQKKLRRKDIMELPPEIIINCTGLGSRLLFDDPAPHLLLRGHLLHRSKAPLITNSANEIISYNYTPEPSIYSDSGGNACDVYCYPRKDGWILGGSRQEGTIDTKGKWKGEDIASSFYEAEEIKFPKQIIDLNRQLLEHSFKVSFGKTENYKPMVGYRFIRKEDSGLRLEKETIQNKTVYHNYGHGGAGVTLSWGCSIDLATKITSQDISELTLSMLRKIKTFV